MKHCLLSLVCALVATGASAQSGARPDPTAPKAPVPRIEYRSAFEGYRPLGEDKPAPWRESNDSVKAKPPAPEIPPAKSGEHRGQR
jgi:hypothetical protein